MPIDAITLDNPLHVLRPRDVCFNNMKLADKYHDLDSFIGAVQGWINENEGITFDVLEKSLRNWDFNTHLIAVDLDPEMKKHGFFYLVPDGTKTPADYECIVSCGPRETAWTAIMSYYHTLYKERGEPSTEKMTDMDPKEVVRFIDRVFKDNEKRLATAGWGAYLTKKSYEKGTQYLEDQKPNKFRSVNIEILKKIASNQFLMQMDRARDIPL